jgi:hypothetical protein
MNKILFSFFVFLALTRSANVGAADQKISAMTSLDQSSWASGDLFPIVDLSANQTKKTSVADFDARYLLASASQLQGPDGTVSAPGIRLTTDSDTGLFQTGDGNLSIAANGTLKASFDQNTINFYAVSGVDISADLDVGGNISAANFPQTGPNNTLAYFNGTGDLDDLPNYSLNSFGAVGSNLTYEPNGGTGGYNIHETYFTLDPIANTPNESQNLYNLNYNIDPNSTGFTLGTAGTLGSILNMGFNHQGTSNIGQPQYIFMNSDIGNGTDPLTMNGFSMVTGFLNIDDNVTVSNMIQGYGFQPNMAENSVMNNGIKAFYDNANIQTAVAGYTGIELNSVVEEIKNNSNFTGMNLNAAVDTFTGNAAYNGIAVGGTLGTFDTGAYQGILVNPTVTSVVNATGLWVDMTNVTASGNKLAAYFGGDVQITGDLNFSGALSIGQLSSFGTLDPVIDGGGNPTTVNQLISSVNIPDNATTANADTIGANSAMLLTVGDNSAVTLGAFGLFSALALPAVIETHTGSVLPRLQGGTFALSFSGTSTGGTIQSAEAGRFVMIPNGITTVDRAIGVLIEQPFGVVGTENFGVYQTDAEKNYFEGSVESEGGVQLSTSGSQPTCDAAHRGMFWNIEGGAGVADILQICQKTVLDTYTWITK